MTNQTAQREAVQAQQAIRISELGVELSKQLKQKRASRTLSLLTCDSSYRDQDERLIAINPRMIRVWFLGSYYMGMKRLKMDRLPDGKDIWRNFGLTAEGQVMVGSLTGQPDPAMAYEPSDTKEADLLIKAMEERLESL